MERSFSSGQRQGKPSSARIRVVQDMIEGLRMARECDHDEARWLCGLFPGGSLTAEVARTVFLSQGEEPKALYFAGVLSGNDRDKICRAAELGYARAQSHMTVFCIGKDRFKWASLAAAQGDSFGLFMLSQCYLEGSGCVVDKKRANRILRDAGDKLCYWALSTLYAIEADSLEKMRYCCQMMAFTVGRLWIRAETNHVVKVFIQTRALGEVVFLAGMTLRGNLNEKTQTVFGSEVDTPSFASCKQAVALSDFWIDSAREMCITWVLCAQRMGLNRDVRRKISELLWETKKEALHEFPRRALGKKQLMATKCASVDASLAIRISA